MNIPVFDLHCDTAFALLGEDRNSAGSLKKNNLHIDLERSGQLEGYAQCFACYTTPMMEQWFHVSPITIFERELASIQREIDQNKRKIGLAYSAADVERNFEKGKASAILTLEGTAGFGYNPELLEDLYLIGFRMVSLTWNEQNPLAGSHQTGGGLTDLGREFVSEAQRLGMIIDVSHLSDEAFYHIMDMTTAPIVASHSNSRALCNVSRNVTDDMFHQICQSGGVVGINQYANFVAEKPNLDKVCDHVIHFLEMDPDGKHIALGADLDGCDELVEGFEGVQSYPAMAAKLLERGVSEPAIRNIFWNNALGVMERCCM
jgi:membrane dipeptidase